MSVSSGQQGNDVSLATLLLLILRRQLLLSLRRPVEVAQPLLFFSLVLLMFPLGIGPTAERLAPFAAGALWIVALLANLLAVEGIFRSDFEDGSLDQLLLSPQPIYFLIMPYLFAHWLSTGGLLALCSPIFAYGLALNSAGTPVLMASLLLGAGVMTIVGALGAALTVGLNRGGMLITLLIMPLYVPVLIFGVAGVNAAIAGQSAVPFLSLLAGLFFAALALGPLAIGAALRIGADN
ncbi:MAG: heme exporter protein CcmB [Pseudomonadota bacterium]